MSIYSGQFDVYDYFYDKNDDDILNTKVYIGNNIISLRINSRKDLVPYYGHGIIICLNNSITITDYSLIDEESNDIIEYYQKNIIRFLKNSKRKNIKVDKDYFNDRPLLSFNREIYIEIFHRLLDNNMYISDIHTNMWKICKEELYDEMIKEGYDEKQSLIWCYGFDEYCERKKEK